MTLIVADRYRPESAVRPPAWTEVEPGFWAGNDAGEFLGTIESRNGRFVAFDAVHRHLGEFATLAQAQTRAAGASRE